jgi:release factor glutamine methyltransferase
MESLTGWKKIDRVLNKQLPLLPDTISLLEKYTAELLEHRPVQYVLNESWFYGLKFFVNEHVLIPRPETEELVEWIIKAESIANRETPLQIIDIGTGSGCIPVSLKKNIRSANVFAVDISEDALQTAKKNADANDTVIHFTRQDFLDKSKWGLLPKTDIIVSNPPYISINEKSAMAKNVVEYEPGLALFVNDNDPLIFYKGIADFAETNLNKGGSVFLEIHESAGDSVVKIFLEKGYSEVILKKDMQGKDRMVRAKKTNLEI